MTIRSRATSINSFLQTAFPLGHKLNPLTTTTTTMLSFLRASNPAPTANATNNPIKYDDGRSSVTFRSPGSEFIMTHRIPPTTKEHGVSIVAPPHHYHIYQDETFRVQSGIGHFYRGFDTEPFVELSSQPGAQTTAGVSAGVFHKFENASKTEDLVVDIHLTPETYENEQRFFRNFFGYLDDCRASKRAPNLFQLLVMLNSADTPVAVPTPWLWLSRFLSRLLTTGGALVGKWFLGFKESYPEYYEEGKSR